MSTPKQVQPKTSWRYHGMEAVPTQQRHWRRVAGPALVYSAVAGVLLFAVWPSGDGTPSLDQFVRPPNPFTAEAAQAGPAGSGQPAPQADSTKPGLGPTVVPRQPPLQADQPGAVHVALREPPAPLGAPTRLPETTSRTPAPPLVTPNPVVAQAAATSGSTPATPPVSTPPATPTPETTAVTPPVANEAGESNPTNSSAIADGIAGSSTTTSQP